MGALYYYLFTKKNIYVGFFVTIVFTIATLQIIPKHYGGLFGDLDRKWVSLIFANIRLHYITFF